MLVFPNPCYAGEEVRLQVTQEQEGAPIFLRAIRRLDDSELLIGELEVQ